MKRTLSMLAVLLLFFSACAKTAQTQTPLDKLPDDYSLGNAKDDGCVVFENGDVTSGQKAWGAFVTAANQGHKATVRLAYYYTLLDPSHYAPEHYEEIKDDYPQLYVKDLSFGGDTYTISGYEDGELITKEYPYLVRYEDEPKKKDAAFSKIIYYVMVNDKSVTWDEIQHGLLSSHFGDAIDHCQVYSDMVMK